MRRALLGLSVLLFTAPAFAQDTLDNGVSADLVLTPELSGLNGVVAADFLPDGRMLMVEQNSGRILLWDGNNAPVEVGDINIQSGGNERGLLNIVVDPMFASSNRIYLYYSTNNAQSVGYVLFMNNEIQGMDPTELIGGLAANRNHDGGGLAFGPDGLLYIGVGDTGCNCNCSPGTNTDNYFPTCLNKLHGKILRIDRDGNIPANNPLVGVTDVAGCGNADSCNTADELPMGMTAPRTEIYNWGFRNPWRINFHPAGPLWIGDVGEVTNEEITISTGGAQHHGWPFREGEAGQPDTACNASTPQSGTCVDPAEVLSHRSGAGSITGGAFATHCSWPAPFQGQYFFGDYVQSRVWTLTPNATGEDVMGQRTTIVRNAGGPVHFVQGPNGAIYYINVNRGSMFSIRPANPVPCDMDAGTPDTGPADTGTPDTGPADTGPGPDSGPVADTGPAADTGPVADTGPAADTGAGSPDAGTNNPDAAAQVDAGDGGDDDKGCNCSASNTGSEAALWGVFAVLAFVGLGRRRRR